jgi:hypothetical protein
MDVDALVSQANENNSDFEFFMELHRRAPRNFDERRGERYEWDCMVIGPGFGAVERVRAQKDRSALVQEYDSK